MSRDNVVLERSGFGHDLLVLLCLDAMESKWCEGMGCNGGHITEEDSDLGQER